MSAPNLHSEPPSPPGLLDRLAGWVFLGVLAAGIVALVAFVVVLHAGIEAFAVSAAGEVGSIGDGLLLGLIVAPTLVIAYFLLEAFGESLGEWLVSLASPGRDD